MNNKDTQLKVGVLSLADCMMIAIGGMVGSAIFTLSGVTYNLAGPVAIVSWIFAGVVVLLYAFNLAELATTFPKSGGLSIYPYRVLGKTKNQKTFAGWISAWSWLNVTVLGTAFSAIFISTYLGALIPALQNQQVIIAIIWIALCWLLNVLGISFMGKINLVLTLGLIIACLIYIFTGFSSIDMSFFTPFVGQGVMGTKGILTSIPIAMLAFNSVIAVASCAEEIKNPQKTIPRAMIFAVIITTILYGLILFTTYGLFPAKELIGNDFALYAPLNYGIARTLSGNMWLNTVVAIAALLALTTTMLVLVMDAGRTLMTSAQSGVLPKAFGKIHPKFHTPFFALTVMSIVSAVIACFPQFTMQIISTGSLCCGITVGIQTITLIVKKQKKIDNPGGFKVPGGIIFPIITLIVLAVTLTQLEKSAFVLSGWWYLIGLVIFVIAYYSGKKQLGRTD